MEPAIWPPRPSIVKPLVILVFAGLAWMALELCRTFGRSHAEIAQDVVEEQSQIFSAFGMLHRATCESSPDLQTFVPSKLQRDPWGNPYLFLCNARGFTVVSAGEDGVFFTPDDIRSDR